MAVAFAPGQVVSRGDLDIFLINSQGNPADAAEISFALYYVDPGPPEAEVLMGSPARVPTNPSVGEYYAAIMVPQGSVPGTYRIRWTFKELSSSPYQMVVQEFAVVTQTALLVPGYSAGQTDMIRRLRMMIRDNAPDKFYHFRPPEHEADTNQFNQVFGQIWQDDELLEYCERALDSFNAAPPMTREIDSIDKLVNDSKVRQWRTTVLWGAAQHACFALQANWSADEFSVHEQTLVTIILPNGVGISLAIGELYDILHGPEQETLPWCDQLRQAFKNGTLLTRSVDPDTGTVLKCPVTAVLRHASATKPLVQTILDDGRTVTTTLDHSLFHPKGPGIVVVPAGQVREGDQIVCVEPDALSATSGQVIKMTLCPPDEWTYDLSIPGPQNFVLANGILAHNSYSIGGVSLDLDKSSKYQSLADTAGQQFDKGVEHKQTTVKYMRGLQQPRFGIGVRSGSLGMSSGRGIMGPRSFVVLPWAMFCGSLAVDVLTHAHSMSSLFM